MARYKVHMCSFYTTMARASAMNSYILISAQSERQSEEGADTDQQGRRRLATEVFAAVCYFKGKLMATEKGNNDSRSGVKGAAAHMGEKVHHSIPFQVKM